MAELPSHGGTDAGRVTRHKFVDRLYHWTMAVSIFVLIGTSFLPIFGFKFPWVTAHWIAGVVLALLVIYHIVRALGWQDWREMGVGINDVRRAAQSTEWVLRRRTQSPDLPGKYPLLQKLYHHGIALLVLTLIGTGGLMLAKIDSPFWRKNPYFLSSESWGLVYTLHDLCAMAVVAMVMVHIYFAIRPEKLWITRSMIRGWITTKELHEHHDTSAWMPEPHGDAPASAAKERPAGDAG